MTAGQFGAWTPIGSVQVAGGYDVAWKNASAGLYTVWKTDTNGNYLSSPIGAVTGSDPGLEALEPTFNQDLNGDGSIGVPTAVVSNDGTTQLTQVGSNYFLYATGTTTGPELKFLGNAFTSGQIGGWAPIGAIKTAGGYEVAWKLAGSNQFTFWNLDNNGNYVSSATGVVTGSSPAFAAAAGAFSSDQNGSGTGNIFTTLIATDGGISLTEVNGNYFLYAAGTTNGPELNFLGGNVIEGQFPGWSPIGAVQTAGGYEVAWKNAASGAYSLWNTDNTGHFTSGMSATMIGANATVEVLGSSSASYIFTASTGTLKLDQPSTFTGAIVGFTGDGTLAGSDQIDLKGISFATLTDSYNNGVLNVSDGTHSAALNFLGSYTLANFHFADDHAGGTIVYDPPVAALSQAAAAGTGNTGFAASNTGQVAANQLLGAALGENAGVAAPPVTHPLT